ncbi:hypothetical protein SAMN05443662_1447 [Sulfurivirga caldicuralii]|uniref:Uncharacterized protein n=1 Tax=Sulfurivirga caldicuralii TaxID=364032 RepID=A0A1N6GQ74_9GAMM|nr:hypothetical protein [Sulfurivirga caldicuralii]SIO09711.1 hypothetical protein SAMN05443662_1447 [Sulfurivirga caldicuralii]
MVENADSSPSPEIHLIDYARNGFLEIDDADLDEIAERLKSASNSWLRICGLPEERWLKRFGDLIELRQRGKRLSSA